MTVTPETMISLTDVNQNFSKVTRMVEEYGSAVILKNNKPKYVVVDFNEYDEIIQEKERREAALESITD